MRSKFTVRIFMLTNSLIQNLMVYCGKSIANKIANWYFSVKVFTKWIVSALSRYSINEYFSCINFQILDSKWTNSSTKCIENGNDWALFHWMNNIDVGLYFLGYLINNLNAHLEQTVTNLALNKDLFTC